MKLKYTGFAWPGGSPMTLVEHDGDTEGLLLGAQVDWGWQARLARAGLVGAGPQVPVVSRGDWHRLVQVAMRVRRLDSGQVEVAVLQDGVVRSAALLPRLDKRSVRRSTMVFGPGGLVNGEAEGFLAATLVGAELHNTALSDDDLAVLERPPRRTDRPSAPTYALIIGVSDYARLDASTGAALGASDLKGATNDVRSYAMLARTMGVPASNIRVLSAPLLSPNDFGTVVRGRNALVDMNMAEADLRHATAAEIRAGIEWLGERLGAGAEGARGLVFFSGHTVVTTAGHLALAGMDTARSSSGQPPSGFGHGIADDWAWLRYFRLVGVVRRLAGLLDTDDPVRVVDVFHDCFSEDACTLASITAALERAGVDFSRADKRAEMRSFIHLTEGPNLGGALQQARSLGLDVRRAHAVLPTDPFAEDDELDGLVSYMYALTGGLMPLSEDRAVTVVLETCMASAPGREIRRHYHENGIPTAHGNAAVFASCPLEQNSHTGVFDNRWHGAFTRALTSQLSQRKVCVSDCGRCFDIPYAQLQHHINQQLALVNFGEQPCVMFCQSRVRDWPVFGQGEWDDDDVVTGTIDPVKLKEEIDPGTTGTIFGVRESGKPTSGLLVVIGSVPVQTPWGGSSFTWQAGHEYWVGGIPSGSFDLVRPDHEPADVRGATLRQWLTANLSRLSRVGLVTFPSLSFDTTGGGSQSSSAFGGHFRVRRVVGAGTPELLARVKRLSDQSLQWFRTSAVTGSRKLAFVRDPRAMVLPTGERIEFGKVQVALRPVTWQSSALTDQMP